MKQMSVGFGSRQVDQKWSRESGLPLKNHLEYMTMIKDRNGWDEQSAALELILSITGSAQKFIQSLKTAERENFTELCERLKELYITPKDPSIRLREFSEIYWDRKSTIKELGALIKGKLEKLSGDGNMKNIDAVLCKNQLIQAIRKKDAPFANFIERHCPPSSKPSEMEKFDELVTWATEIQPTFAATTEGDGTEDEEMFLIDSKRHMENDQDTMYRQDTIPQTFQREHETYGSSIDDNRERNHWIGQQAQQWGNRNGREERRYFEGQDSDENAESYENEENNYRRVHPYHSADRNYSRHNFSQMNRGGRKWNNYSNNGRYNGQGQWSEYNIRNSGNRSNYQFGNKKINNDYNNNNNTNYQDFQNSRNRRNWDRNASRGNVVNKNHHIDFGRDISEGRKLSQTGRKDKTYQPSNPNIGHKN